MTEQNRNKPATSPASEMTRPTKKQRELLVFLDQFITEHGYSPSYREIMRGCGYNSVATVALHINNLIKRGHVVKRDHSARSLEVVQQSQDQPLRTNQVRESEEKWLVGKIEHLLMQQESLAVADEAAVADIELLIQALRVLGLDGAAQSLAPRARHLQAERDV